jgi:hypothetical protein
MPLFAPHGSFGQPELGILEGAGPGGSAPLVLPMAMTSLERFKPGDDLFSAKSLNRRRFSVEPAKP